MPPLHYATLTLCQPTGVPLACYDEGVTQVHKVVLASTSFFTGCINHSLLFAASGITERRADLPGDYLKTNQNKLLQGRKWMWGFCSKVYEMWIGLTFACERKLAMRMTMVALIVPSKHCATQKNSAVLWPYRLESIEGAFKILFWKMYFFTKHVFSIKILSQSILEEKNRQFLGIFGKRKGQ